MEPGEVLEEFKKLLSQRWTQRPKCPLHTRCHCLQVFHNTPSIQKWMLESSKPGEPRARKNVELLLESQKFATPTFEEEDWDPKSIFKNEKGSQCVLVFSLLLSMGEGKLLYYFQFAGYNDANLGECNDAQRINTLNRTLRDQDHQQTSAASDLERYIKTTIASFNAKRWRFCPVLIDENLWKKDVHCHNMLIMPFCARNVTSHKGATATVYKVLVQEEFVSDTIKTPLGPPSDYDEYLNCYIFVIKSYSEGQSKIFQNERKAYRGLLNIPGVIHCFGTFSVTTSSATPSIISHNLILQHGSMDLYEYYGKTQPPQTSYEIIASWKLLCDVARAIQDVHELDRLKYHYHGWHGDVKPDNILLVKNKKLEDELKLSDFGFAEFTERRRSRSGLPKVSPRGRTETYGPPEQRQVDKKFDIWSFGCVLSVHATWITAGFNEVIAFSVFRSDANKKKESTRDSDAFHDGREVLKEIKEWHNVKLKQIMRKSDVITSDVLDFVGGSMLLSDPSSRSDAQKVCEELLAIVDKAEKKALPMMEGVSEALQVEIERRRSRLTSNEEISRPTDTEQSMEADYLLSTTRSDTKRRSHHSSGTKAFWTPRSSRVEDLDQTPKFTDVGDMIPAKYGTANHSTRKASTHLSSHSGRGNSSPPGQDMYESVPSIGSNQNGVPDRHAKENWNEDEAPPEISQPPDQSETAKLSSSQASMQIQTSEGTSVHTQDEGVRNVSIAAADRGPASEVPEITVHSPTLTSPQNDPIYDSESTNPDVGTNFQVAEPSSLSSTSQQGSSVPGSRLVPWQPDDDDTEPDNYGHTEGMRLAIRLDLDRLCQILPQVENISVQDNFGKTVLHHLVIALASKPKESPKVFSEILEVIVQKGPRIINQSDEQKHTPLYYARHTPYLVDKLIAAGAQADKESFDIAVYEDCFHLIKRYLETREHANVVGWIKSLDTKNQKKLLGQLGVSIGQQTNEPSLSRMSRRLANSLSRNKT